MKKLFRKFLVELKKNKFLLLATIYWWFSNVIIGVLQLFDGDFFDDSSMWIGNYVRIRQHFEPPYEIALMFFNSLENYDITEFLIYSSLPFLIWLVYQKISK